MFRKWTLIDWDNLQTLPPEGKRVVVCFFLPDGRSIKETALTAYNWQGVGRVDTGIPAAWADLPDERKED